ncbi:hypothetical protein [Hymenobacter elongatus]|uniref:Uncharacterized protein n=1 Tax=Hymenobacter elongatus TaxID=877208 RepID=A0A4Z0PEJ1_9BACT|nr:hypothetical protein [Hymenobacter elongatus]TGE12805.1 hypothetical protein E5J99_19985 [Hymenobacter elongatus]
MRHKNNSLRASIATSIGLAFLIILVKQLAMLPWWSFTVVVFALGLALPYRRWNLPVFGIGFLVGFVVWAGANTLYGVLYQAELFDKVASVMGLQKIVLLLASGLIGGLLTGLSFLAGKSVVFQSKPEVGGIVPAK